MDVENAGDADDGYGIEYQREVTQRLSRLEHGAIHIEIDHTAAYDGGVLMLQFSHNGKPSAMQGCPTLRSLERICASVQIGHLGQKVVVFYQWNSA